MDCALCRNFRNPCNNGFYPSKVTDGDGHIQNFPGTKIAFLIERFCKYPSLPVTLTEIYPPPMTGNRGHKETGMGFTFPPHEKIF